MQARSRTRLWLGASLALPLLILAVGLWLEFGGLVESRRAEERARAMEVLSRVREDFAERKAKALVAIAEESIRVDDLDAPVHPFLRRRPEAELANKRELSAAGRIGVEKEVLGEHEQALPFLELALKDSKDSRLVLAKARCLWKLEQADKALDLLRGMMQAGPATQASPTGRANPSKLPEPTRLASHSLEPGFLLPAELRAAALAAHLLAQAGRMDEVARIQQDFYAFGFAVPIEAAETSDRLFASFAPMAQQSQRARYRSLAEAWRHVEIHGIPQSELVLAGGTLIGARQGQLLPVLGHDALSVILNASLAEAPQRWKIQTRQSHRANPQEKQGKEALASPAPTSPFLASLRLSPLPLEISATPTFLLDSRLLQMVGRGLMVLALLSFVLGNLLVWRMLRRELELSRLRSDFIDLISHELRTPLTALSLKAELLAHGEVRADKVGSYQRGLKVDVDRLALLVGEILDFARLEKGRTPLEKRETSTRALLARGLGEARTALRLSRHRIRVQAARDLPSLEIDLDLLARALRNLLENASKYAPEGSEIRLAAELCEEGLRLSVCDQGPGIPKQERERIFEPFIRGANAVGKPGSGLGLALVRQAVEAHGGQVRVEDSSPQGARFSVTLPLGDVA